MSLTSSPGLPGGPGGPRGPIGPCRGQRGGGERRWGGSVLIWGGVGTFGDTHSSAWLAGLARVALESLGTLRGQSDVSGVAPAGPDTPKFEERGSILTGEPEGPGGPRGPMGPWGNRAMSHREGTPAGDTPETSEVGEPPKPGGSGVGVPNGIGCGEGSQGDLRELRGRLMGFGGN